MSSLSVMEWNAKSPLQWDWEHLVMFNAKTAQFPKKLQPTDWRIEGEVGADAAPLYPSGSGCGFGSDLGHGSLSKSSKSASSNSALVGKASKFTIEKGFPGEFNNKKELSKDKATRTPLTLDASVKSGEPLIGLKLGKRTYFEDFSLGSNAKSSSISVIPMSSSSTTKKSRSCAHATRCQVEGCNLDLSSAKEYHQKHRICNIHAKCPKVIVGGLERRFCQQCSRFHSVLEFDEKKRSCRKRLSDHNARRRKPRFEEFQFNSARLSSSLNGLEESIVSSRSVSSNLDATQDLHHAPSLLSTNSWGSCPPEPLSLDNPLQLNDTTMSFSVPQYSSIAVSEYWQTEQQSTDFRAHTLTPSSNGSNHFQELQMFYNKWN